MEGLRQLRLELQKLNMSHYAGPGGASGSLSVPSVVQGARDPQLPKILAAPPLPAGLGPEDEPTPPISAAGDKEEEDEEGAFDLEAYAEGLW